MTTPLSRRHVWPLVVTRRLYVARSTNIVMDRRHVYMWPFFSTSSAAWQWQVADLGLIEINRHRSGSNADDDRKQTANVLARAPAADTKKGPRAITRAGPLTFMRSSSDPHKAAPPRRGSSLGGPSCQHDTTEKENRQIWSRTFQPMLSPADPIAPHALLGVSRSQPCQHRPQVDDSRRPLSLA